MTARESLFALGKPEFDLTSIRERAESYGDVTTGPGGVVTPAAVVALCDLAEFVQGMLDPAWWRESVDVNGEYETTRARGYYECVGEIKMALSRFLVASDCPSCNARGEVWVQEPEQRWAPCPKCVGAVRVPAEVEESAEWHLAQAVELDGNDSFPHSLTDAIERYLLEWKVSQIVSLYGHRATRRVRYA